MAEKLVSAAPTKALLSNYQPKIIRNPDGTYSRSIQFPTTPSNPDPTSSSPVVTKDIPINPTNQTWLRIFLPSNYSKTNTKLPLIVYFHGGGFVFVSAASTLIHDFCTNIVTQLGVMVASVEYRLAPEHRLPAAYDDAVEALHFIRTCQEQWLRDFADSSKCFLMGSSAGGNIAFHAGVILCGQVQSLEPLKIKGLVLHHPFFGGSDRTGSELRLGSDPVLSLAGCDYMWELALPVGADRDDVYSNPMVGSGPGLCDAVREAACWVLVTGCYGDLLVDRQMEFAKMLGGKGVKTVAHFYEGYHSMEVSEPSKAHELFSLLRDFISKCF